MKKSILQPKIAQLPQNPGVYFFRGTKGEILYIGKATNLKSRVSSYFRGEHNRGEWISKMISLVKDIEVQETDSVLEALILESNLIKKHQPKYNTLEKDDKSFSYFVITKEEFPRVIILRKTDLEKNSEITKYQFGPYTSKQQMQVALKIIRRIFPFHALKQKTEKGCLDFQLGRCPGPYAGAISKADYSKNIRGIKMILEGKKKSLLKRLELLMVRYSNNNEFEKAGEIRNKIFALNHIRDVALMGREFENVETRHASSLRIEAYDISNIGGQNSVGSMVVFDNGKPNKSQYRKFKIKTIEGSDDVGSMREVLARRFKNDWPMPDLILLDGGAGHLNMAEKLLHEELGLAVNIAAVAKGPTRKKLDIRMAKSDNISSDTKKILSDDNLIKSIMDEAHRFAITFHRKLRSKNALK